MKQITFAIFLSIALSTFSQENYSSETYRVTLGDIEANTFKKDSTANALVIYEQGNSYVDRGDYDLRTNIKRKIKILNKEGFDHADVTIYLYNNKSNYEKVEDIIATTYNKIDGEVIKSKLSDKNIFREEYDENYTLVKFTLPNIKEGSVVSYSYSLKSPFMFKYKGWDFQHYIPTLYSEYKASIPGIWEYNIKKVGGKKLFINTNSVEKNCLEASNGSSASCLISTYAMKNIPAFIKEDYMTAEENYLSRVEYELKTFTGFDGVVTNYTKTWKTVDKELKTHPSIGKQLNKSIKSGDLLSPDIINEKDLLKKAKSIYQFVQNNYTWNNKYKIFKNVSVKDLLKNKSGNISSINILLHNLLKASKIDVKPVLLSTRDNGFPTKIYPVISNFNYLIVQASINGETYLLDATDNYLSFGDIPFKCLNETGRLLDFKNGSEWINIEAKNNSNIFYEAELNINENDKFTGFIHAKSTGYHGLTSKKAYFPNKNAYVENLENNFPYVDISNHQVSNNGISSPEFEEKYDIEYNYDDIGGNIYLNPFFVKFFKENPFKLQERTYPIDFGYKDTYYYSFKLNFNENYSIVEKPKDFNINLPNKSGKLLFYSTLLDNNLTIIFKIDFNESFYHTGYYDYLKEFMNKIVDIQTNSIILLKKSS